MYLAPAFSSMVTTASEVIICISNCGPVKPPVEEKPIDIIA